MYELRSYSERIQNLGNEIQTLAVRYYPSQHPRIALWENCNKTGDWRAKLEGLSYSYNSPPWHSGTSPETALEALLASMPAEAVKGLAEDRVRNKARIESLNGLIAAIRGMGCDLSSYNIEDALRGVQIGHHWHIRAEFIFKGLEFGAKNPSTLMSVEVGFGHLGGGMWGVLVTPYSRSQGGLTFSETVLFGAFFVEIVKLSQKIQIEINNHFRCYG